MRLWSIHPQYLDTKGLLAVWREGLLAKKVLQGRTKGYRRHPQLIRFRRVPGSSAAINCYLKAIQAEAAVRGYRFDKRKIGPGPFHKTIPVTRGQIHFEVRHLLDKLKTRDMRKYKYLKNTVKIKLHPLFRTIGGGIESWEKGAEPAGRSTHKKNIRTKE
ncbi:MAG: hypothetical protein EHM45_03825 [Desulfobacteraceae bacterium]|nr:MAG: hypothetical protein EHM45_03825 [Desulfobacteraceae bacterium]